MKRFQEVAPGILRGGLPTSAEIFTLKNTWNIKRIISLDLEAGEKIDPICNRLNIEHLILPIEYNDSSDKKEIYQTLRFLSDNIIKLLTTNQPVYIHCVHGRDRTGLAIALYRIKGEGKSIIEALSEAEDLDFGDGLSSECLELFLSVLKQTDQPDKNEADVVTQVRDSFYSGSATGEGTESNYFSPIPPVQEFVIGYPKSSLSPESFAVDDQRRRYRHRRKMILQDLNEAMAYVGLNDNVSPILRYVSPIGRNTSSEGVGPLGILPYGNYYL